MVIIFTGNGKGKTTAAIGQAIRALGRGKKVLILQFIKNIETGEHLFFKKLKNKDLRFKIIPAGKGFVKILGDKLPLSEHKKAAQNALKLAKREIAGKKWDFIILDELNVAASLKLVKQAEILKILKSAPKNKIIILTGRGAPKSFIKLADLVTEMKEIKHPYNKGAKAMAGVEL